MELELAHVNEVLRRTPSTLNSLLRDLPEPWLVHNEGPDTWSPYDIIGHLIHGEETDWIPRAKIILEHGETRPFEPFDRVAMFEKSKGKSIAELLDTFARLRDENLRELQKLNLTAELLAKRGMHPELGVVTLKQLLATSDTPADMLAASPARSLNFDAAPTQISNALMPPGSPSPPTFGPSHSPSPTPFLGNLMQKTPPPPF